MLKRFRAWLRKDLNKVYLAAGVFWPIWFGLVGLQDGIWFGLLGFVLGAAAAAFQIALPRLSSARPWWAQ